MTPCLTPPPNPQLVEVMVDMASNLMLVDEHLLWLAQREDKACSGIVGALERIGGAALSPHTQHISVVMWGSWEGAPGGPGTGRALRVIQEGNASLSGSKPSNCAPAMNTCLDQSPHVWHQILSGQGQCKEREARHWGSYARCHGGEPSRGG